SGERRSAHLLLLQRSGYGAGVLMSRGAYDRDTMSAKYTPVRGWPGREMGSRSRDLPCLRLTRCAGSRLWPLSRGAFLTSHAPGTAHTKSNRGTAERRLGPGNILALAHIAQRLLCRNAGGLGALEVDLRCPLGRICQDDDLVVDHFDESAVDGDRLLVTTAHDAKLALLQQGYERRVTRQDSE